MDIMNFPGYWSQKQNMGEQKAEVRMWKRLDELKEL